VCVCARARARACACDVLSRIRSRSRPLFRQSSTHFQGKLPTIKSQSGRGGVGGQPSAQVAQPPLYIPNQRVDIRDLTWEVRLHPLSFHVLRQQTEPIH